ncbi:N(2),N(2)-dimethylguanosine tRNA methyltransferase [Methanocella conradii HZ254]|uniref:tRNA (guanine(26)-N(2))-dimethyltransferase n=1 Tax=Methanocella conradii (strain DSM 24694 / JCM 17849 / CGMCC 1.5162 / HZ254) TaxID=1041930 RepID=H8I4R6_METCZ|nr:tRNA (guanine(10)-N(2))-dimethyltransferase [Methanocella conradii]AFD00661.1 N(2),N(2)-dimethylguanosine tRNA methyltransferase [Methanocella conradii HZ254]MDI6896359.1 tRNA (guanine(10)-N(2))-dimethyltransferase [Methanocella conradii]
MIEEGCVSIDVGKGVFYNPRMEMNRDITVACLEALPEVSTYVDAMGASGIRGIRVKKEVSRDVEVTINDWDATACELIKRNALSNGVKVSVSNCGANTLLSSTQFDFVDIDPFGTPAPYINSTCWASKRAMGITATDTAPLCGAHLKSGIRTYAAYPLKTEYYAEMGLRVLLGKVAREEAKYDRALKPLLCHATEHYIRLYLGVEHGRAAADRMMKEMGFIVHCFKCKNRFEAKGLAPLALDTCPVCGAKVGIGGPVWLGATKDKAFVEKVIGVLEKGRFNKKGPAIKMLSIIKDELDMPTFYDQHAICRDLKATPSDISTLIRALNDLGYSASRTHYLGVGFKTDAPINIIKGTVLRLSKNA